MKLYYSPGACSLADHAALHEAGLSFEHVRVDLKTKRTEHGDDYAAINPKGYVPAIELDDGTVLTENAALLDWIADQSDALRPADALARTRRLEALAYISGEVHKAFGPFFRGGSDEEKKAAGELVVRKLGYLAERMEGPFLFGDRVSAADFYLFVMLLWATRQKLDLPGPLPALRDRMMALESVRTAMRHEGLLAA